MNKRRILSVVLGLALVISCGMIVRQSDQAEGLSGGDWSASRIVDDAIFFNAGTMNPGDIQNFLNAKVPTCDTNGTQSSGYAGYPTRASYGIANGVPPPYICLRNYTQTIPSVAADAYCNGIGGGTKSAADIIFNVAQACNINPQALIVLLQKEQSLVSDDWPWPIQYRSATGYGCPDTAACDSQYYGFFNQVYNAGRQFRRYIQLPQNFNHAVGRTSFIGYNPSSSCGGTNVTIATQATAALYNYTPYQPNQAALDNLYGLGNGCSAYGNRNFWRLFNDWFGSTRIDSFTVALSDDGSLSQYLLFGGIKQAIPDPETKIAWGIQNYPLVTMPASYLATLPSGPYLDRLTRLNTSDQTVFFMDGGKRYRVTSQAMFDAWNFGSRPITNVPPGLFYIPTDGGELSFSVKNPANSTNYMLDGGNGSSETILRPYNSETVRKAWEGESARVIDISSDFFGRIDNAIGATLTITKIAYGGNEYQVIAGQRMTQPISVAALYPGVAQSVSTATFNRLAATAQATHLIRSTTSPDVYLIDGGTKHHLLWPSLLSTWSNSSLPINLVNSSYAALIPTGDEIDTNLADVSGQLYVIDSTKLTVPAAVDTAYRSAGNIYSASSTLTGLFSNNATQATGFIKGRNSPSVYLIDNSGNLRHIEYPDKLGLIAGTTSITILSDSILDGFARATSPSLFVSDGINEYVFAGGQKLLVESDVKTDWGLASAQTYSDDTLDRFSTGSSLTNSQQENGKFYLIRSGAAYVTVDQNIANTWGISSATQRSEKLVTSLLSQFMLTRFVRSSTDSRTFAVDGGNWYNLSAAHRSNLGSANEPTMVLDPDNAPNEISDWVSFVVKDSSGKHYVIDGTTKRSFASSVIQNHWTSNGSLTVPTTTNGFLNLLPNNGTIERAIKGSNSAVYSAENGTKRWILSSTTYNQSYAPFARVSDNLINALPNGTSIP